MIADDSTDPEWVAADLLAQAEHGPGGVAVVITWSEQFADAVDAQPRGAARARRPRRTEAEATLASGGRRVLVDGPAQAIAVANAIAPEHLAAHERRSRDARRRGAQRGRGLLRPVRTRGDRRLRRRREPRAARPAAPRGSRARCGSRTSRSTFTSSTLDRDALERVGPYVTVLAASEGLDAHAQSIRVRDDGEHRRERRAPAARATICARSRATTRPRSTCRCGSTPTRARTRRRPSS